jgi:hypothetical protein
MAFLVGKTFEYLEYLSKLSCPSKSGHNCEIQQIIVGHKSVKTEGILRKFQKEMYLTQKWKNLKNNGTT